MYFGLSQDDQLLHQHSQSSFGRRIHLIFQPEAVINESDLNRSRKSELHVRPIHPPSAIQAKHIFDSNGSLWGSSSMNEMKSILL